MPLALPDTRPADELHEGSAALAQSYQPGKTPRPRAANLLAVAREIRSEMVQSVQVVVRIRRSIAITWGTD